MSSKIKPYHLDWYMKDKVQSFILFCTRDGQLRKSKQWINPDYVSYQFECNECLKGNIIFEIVTNKQTIVLQNKSGLKIPIRVSQIPINNDCYQSIEIKFDGRYRATNTFGYIEDIMIKGSKEDNKDEFSI